MERRGRAERYSRIFAVDFDGTLNLAEKYPLLGEPNEGLFRFLKRRQQAGDKIILWTCREGDYLKSAVKFCRRYGLAFDAVNDNLPENKEYFKNNSRKVYAHCYVDDRNMYFSGERSEYITSFLRDRKSEYQKRCNRAGKQEKRAREILRSEPDREDVKSDLNYVVKLQDRYSALVEFIDELLED